MKNRRGRVAVFFVLLAAGCAATNVEISLSARSGRFQKAIDAVYPALVRIQVIVPVFSDGREVRMQAGGSGVIISPEGHVVTNHHVAGRATSIVCVLPNKEEIRAERIGTDPLADLCVLKLTEQRPYPYARFGDSAKLKVGDTVLAMGSPGSISQSVTAGVVSNVDLILPAGLQGQFRLDGENVGALVKWIAHDAAIFPGNSGGPLVNLDGEIVGINEIGMGLGGAIPSNLAKVVVQQIMERSEPARSVLGIVAQPLLKSSGRKRGVLVSGIVPGGPAEAAGLQPGDIVLSYDGKPVDARFAEDLPVFNRLIFETPVGAEVNVVIERGGEQKTVAVKTKLRERARGDDREVREWGMTARNLMEMEARALKRKSTDGVLVSSVRPGGPCASARPEIQPGDIVVSVGENLVKDLDALRAETARILEGKTEPVPTLVAFERKGEQWLTLVKVGIKELEDRSPEARKAWLPAAHQVLTSDLADALGLAGRTGVRLTSVFEGQSAEKAGLRVGDIITEIDGDPIRASRPEHADVFPAMLRERQVGQTVELTVFRDGKEMKIPVELERSPKATREMRRYRNLDLGFTARDVSDEDRRTEKLDKAAVGPLVSEVEPGSLAAVANLRVSDVVLSVDGTPTPDVAALRQVMSDLAVKKPAYVVFFVKRGLYTLFVEVETPWLPGQQPAGGFTEEE